VIFFFILCTPVSAPTCHDPDHNCETGIVGSAVAQWPIWVAEQKGFFRNVKVFPKLIPFQSSASSLQALAEKAIVLCSLPVLPVAQAIERGLPIKIVAGTIKPIYLIAAHQEVRNLNDLKGKKIAFASLRTESTAMAETMLAAKGLKKGDYGQVQTGGSAPTVAALQAGAVDAAVVSDPLVFFRDFKPGLRLLEDQPFR
jgi:ABC-type nitrate/sulfonate/bicarbonate transport system substrate-binding protein